MEPLMSTADIAHLLSIDRRTATRLTQRADWPAPYVISDGVHRWARRDVERWLAGRRQASPLAGRIPDRLTAGRPTGPRA